MGDKYEHVEARRAPSGSCDGCFWGFVSQATQFGADGFGIDQNALKRHEAQDTGEGKAAQRSAEPGRAKGEMRPVPSAPWPWWCSGNEWQLCAVVACSACQQLQMIGRFAFCAHAVVLILINIIVWAIWFILRHCIWPGTDAVQQGLWLPFAQVEAEGWHLPVAALARASGLRCLSAPQISVVSGKTAEGDPWLSGSPCRATWMRQVMLPSMPRQTPEPEELHRDCCFGYVLTSGGVEFLSLRK